MCECCLAGARGGSAAHNRDVRGSVVRRAEGRERQQVAAQNAGDRMYRVELKHVVEVERGQNRGKRSSEHRLAGAGRAGEAKVVSARSRDYRGALRGGLTADVFESKLRSEEHTS